MTCCSLYSSQSGKGSTNNRAIFFLDRRSKLFPLIVEPTGENSEILSWKSRFTLLPRDRKVFWWIIPERVFIHFRWKKYWCMKPTGQFFPRSSIKFSYAKLLMILPALYLWKDLNEQKPVWKRCTSEITKSLSI